MNSMYHLQRTSNLEIQKSKDALKMYSREKALRSGYENTHRDNIIRQCPEQDSYRNVVERKVKEILRKKTTGNRRRIKPVGSPWTN
ncbi:hypothetical protein J6590_048051 [Homalodisca vitripennis]|nr:hypothetical protein J6590_048051 [Homalodisca vitripennis]